MKKISFFATVIILIASAALTMANNPLGNSDGSKIGMSPGMGESMKPGMDESVGSEKSGCKMGMDPEMAGCMGSKKGRCKMGMCPGMAGCMGSGMGGCKMGMCPGMAGCKTGICPGMSGCKMGMCPGMAGCMGSGMGGCKMGMCPGMGRCMGPGMGGCMAPEMAGCNKMGMAPGMAGCVDPGMGGCTEIDDCIRSSFRMGKMGRGCDMKCLDLSAEQTETIQSLREYLEKGVASLRTQMIEKKEEMKELWEQATLDADAIKAKQAEIHELKGQIREKATDFRLAVRGTLTPEQVAKIAKPKDGPPCQRKGKGQGYGQGCRR